MQFEFATATRIIFGEGSVSQLAGVVPPFGSPVLIVTGNDTSRAQPILELLTAGGIDAATFAVHGEPTTETARAAVMHARASECRVVVAVGGGSALDVGKAVAALLTNGGDPLDYLEVIGAGQKLTRPAAPFIAVPTTAGTGAEVTKNAVLSSPEHSVKVSLRSDSMLPRVALIDPELTYSQPPSVTASTGLDALTQVIEPFVCNRANPITDALCREGISRAGRSLARAYRDGRDPDARRDMALASLFGGLALANAKLGAVHGLAGPLGGMFTASHGAVCARLLAPVMAANIAALRQRDPDSVALERYAEVAERVTGRRGAPAEHAASWARDLCEELRVPRLSTYGVTPASFESVATKASASSSMRGNPVELTRDELIGILEASSCGSHA